jgi:hypothetical protein
MFHVTWRFIMKKIALALSILLAAFLSSQPAFAQKGQQAGPEESKAGISEKATPEQKAAARKARQAEGKAVAKKHEGVTEVPTSGGVAKASTAEEKKAAAAKRRAEAADAVKKGQIPSGEK